MNLVLLLILLSILAGSLRAEPSAGHVTGDLPEHRAEDPSAPAVSEANLLASDRFWPYQVALTEAWQPAGRGQALPAGSTGVLIRVEAPGAARVDFGRDGLYQVPVAKTDLLGRANRIRRGELDKMAPNFVLAIGPRLVDSASDSLRPLSFRAAAEQRGFLAVFADPDAQDFSKLAAALTPLRGRHGVLTILFPQGEHPDAHVREKLRALEWTVPFVYDHLAEAYTRSLLADGISPPAFVLQTNEGRVLLQSAWSAAVVSELSAALDGAFGDAAPRGRVAQD